MWDMIYTFFLQHTGVSYDFTSDIESISGDKIFIEPYAWQSGINLMLDNLQDALDCIELHGDDVPDEMPDKIDLKKIVANYLLGGIVKNLNYIKKTLNITLVDITSYEELETHLYVVGKLVEMLVEHSLDDIMSHHLFDTYITEDEDDDNDFVEVLGLHEKDVFNLSMVVSTIREDYFASLDEEEE